MNNLRNTAFVWKISEHSLEPRIMEKMKYLSFEVTVDKDGLRMLQGIVVMKKPTRVCLMEKMFERGTTFTVCKKVKATIEYYEERGSYRSGVKPVRIRKCNKYISPDGYTGPYCVPHNVRDSETSPCCLCKPEFYKYPWKTAQCMISGLSVPTQQDLAKLEETIDLC